MRSLLALLGLAAALVHGLEADPVLAPAPSGVRGPAEETASAPQRRRGQPTLELAKGERRLHHFGKVLEGGQERHVFRLVSGGSGDLVIENVTANCGCTLGLVSVVDGEDRIPYRNGTPLPPGTELEVEALIDTFGRHGPFSTTLNVRSNAADQRGVILNLRADVQPALVAQPERFDVADLLEKEALVRITGDGQQPFGLSVDGMYEDKAPAGDDCPLAVELTPLDPDEDGRALAWEARVRLNADRMVGSKFFEVCFASDQPTAFQPEPDPEDPETPGTPVTSEGPRTFLTWIGIQGRLERAVTLHPPLVSFGRVDSSPLERTVTIRCRDGRGLAAAPRIELEELSPPELPAEALSWSVSPREDGGLELGLTLGELPADFHGSFQGTLAVHVDHPTLRVARVRFTGARP